MPISLTILTHANVIYVQVMLNTEPKLIFLNGTFSHFSGHRSSGKNRTVIRSLPKHSEADLIAFAESAIAHLRDSGVPFILDNIIRVDLFDNGDGRLVVNEFESLEAGYKTSDAAKNNEVYLFLEMYWESKIYESISNLFA